jgi:hypothetical protein
MRNVHFIHSDSVFFTKTLCVRKATSGSDFCLLRPSEVSRYALHNILPHLIRVLGLDEWAARDAYLSSTDEMGEAGALLANDFSQIVALRLFVSEIATMATFRSKSTEQLPTLDCTITFVNLEDDRSFSWVHRFA